MVNLRRKQYLSRSAPDTRPKWNDPDLTIAEIPQYELRELENHWRREMREFDRFAKATRDRLNKEGSN